VRFAGPAVRTRPADHATNRWRIGTAEAIMDTRVVLAGSSLTTSARQAASYGAAAYPTATPQARVSRAAMEAAFERVGAAIGAFRLALN
jgi:hypothetical protein